MGTDAAGMVPDGCTIEFVTSDGGKGAANGVYETLARYCDEQISKAILGQTLTADSGKGGSYAQSKTHNDVRHDLTVADCKALGATLRDDLIRPLVLFNFGADAAERLPQLVFDCAESDDLKSLSGILQTLVGFGTPVPLSYIYKKFSIPEPQNGEAVAKLPAAPTMPITPPPALGMIANKAGTPPMPPEPAGAQSEIDRLADAATAQGILLFEQILAPLRAMLADGGTLEDIRAALGDSDRLHPVQADNIFQTNVRTAYNVGAYEEMTDPAVLSKAAPIGGTMRWSFAANARRSVFSLRGEWDCRLRAARITLCASVQTRGHPPGIMNCRLRAIRITCAHRRTPSYLSDRRNVTQRRPAFRWTPATQKIGGSDTAENFLRRFV